MIGSPFRALALVAGLNLALAQVAVSQVAPPGELRELTHEMAEQVNSLSGEIREELGQNPQGRHLMEDSRELAESLREFQGTLANQGNLFQLRQAYSNIDVSWHHLRGQISQLARAERDVERIARRIDQFDGRIHQALGLNPSPPNFYGGAGQAPTGQADLRRLAHALVSRAEQLAAVIPADMANNADVGALGRVAQELAAAADRFHDTLDAGQNPDAVRAAYRPVMDLANRLAVPAASGPPRVQQTWQAFAFADTHIRQALGLPAPQGAPSIGIGRSPAPGGGAPAIVPLSDRLIAQVDAFIAGFGPIANAGPLNPGIMSDAERLRAEALRFRQDIDRGLNASQLAYEYRDIDATWQRMWRRIERASRGGNGPNVERAREIGPTCAQLHQMLGMPGYSPF